MKVVWYGESKTYGWYRASRILGVAGMISRVTKVEELLQDLRIAIHPHDMSN